MLISEGVMVRVLPGVAAPERIAAATMFSTVFWTMRRMGRAPILGS